ncbi:hypothetical protein [Paracoccus sp. SCSIO 75233]|uniref:hypothetical protein n=1 Tax=Paracoccus sp. SCSIO 75233 TaxID=3017782 RepID=UPI0022F10D53|nr:hypothetical protein [Paracoccus sp. SCSIO 75233]WBU52840.1 hypothetical protein PAF12_13615 [Paracoccus sp. SCSIO 75233]
MSRFSATILCSFLLLIFVPIASNSHAQTTQETYAFRDAVNVPPAGYDGPVFKLSRDYPTEDPGACDESECPWLFVDVDFTSGVPVDWETGPWNDYIMAIMEVVTRGQDPDMSNDMGFQTSVDGETAWYHIPWMAYDPTAGREFVHGTTNERTAHLADFLGSPMPNATPIWGMSEACKRRYPHGFESWAVGAYNKWGGYAIGQAFAADGSPVLVEKDGRMQPAGLPFPEGTLVTKFLTTNATPDCVPYLADSAVWTVNRHQLGDGNEYMCERTMQETRLTQVDVAVVDHRSPTRWVYGTFGYAADAPGETVLERLVPLGLQWGSDPQTFPAVPESDSVPATESVLNTTLDTYEHWGCGKRLAGPVDNPKSSCVSCHNAAFAAADGEVSDFGKNIPSVFGFDGICDIGGSADNADYFSNYQFPAPYPGGDYPTAVPLDTSLQMAVAFTQYAIFKNNGEPTACTNPNQF